MKIVYNEQESSVRTVDLSNSFCFLAGTKVITINGEKNIEDINEGEYVYSFNEKTNSIELQKVLRIFENVNNAKFTCYKCLR